MNKSLSLIISREYLERVKRKSFIITTILVPILMIGIMIAPAMFMAFMTPEELNVVVLDNTGVISQRLENNDEIRFILSAEPLDSLRNDESIQAILVIGEGAIKRPNHEISLYTRGSLPMLTDANIQNQLEKAIEDVRLEAYNLGDIRQILKEVEVDLSYQTIRLDSDDEATTSSTLSYFIGLVLDLMLYMFILLYGQMVMNSIIEEKNNKVLEVVVSSVKPSVLMMGKIFGICLVALTQIAIWGVLLGACSAWLVPLTTSGVGTDNAELLGAIGQLSDPSYIISLFFWMILFFIGGYLFYSAMYAAIGSAVDNIQDAGQLSSIPTIPVIIAIIGSMAVIQTPQSGLAFWLSMIPFTSPMVVMARLPFGVPTWELLLSLVILYASFIALIWVCAKIYRIGIFMHGKKPSFIDIVRWIKYK